MLNEHSLQIYEEIIFLQYCPIYNNIEYGDGDMRISPISNNVNFKAQLSPEIKGLLFKCAEDIVAQKGESSKEYRNYANNIRRILDYSPTTKVEIVSVPFYRDVNFFSYEVRGKRRDYLEGEEWRKEELASPSNVEYLAQRILHIHLKDKLKKYRTK